MNFSPQSVMDGLLPCNKNSPSILIKRKKILAIDAAENKSCLQKRFADYFPEIF